MNKALVLACVASLCGGGLGASGAVSDPPAQLEPGNFRTLNRDAAFAAIEAKRTARLHALTPVTDAVLWKPADGDWLTWRRTNASLGYSPLKQISRANVAQLRPAWSLSLPQSNNEITPLVHDGVLFVESGDAVQAIDAATGELLWKYVRPLPAAFDQGRGAIVKNLAIYGNALIAPTADGHVVALEAATGKLIWDHQVLGEPELKAHLVLDGGPVAAKGKLIMGTSGCNTYPGGCFIFALDARTGAEAWRFHTLDQASPGQDSWNGAPVAQRFGGSVWTSGSYDPALNLVYFGVGNTYDTATLLTPHAEKGASNDGLYTAATLALDPDTGQLKWFYQHVNREVWDLDWAFEQSLLTLDVKGKPTDLVMTGGKIALFDAVDRATGRYAFSRDAGLQTLVSAVDPRTGHKTIDPALTPEPGVTKRMCPHSGGGRNWQAAAIDPAAGVLFLQLTESCQDFTWLPPSPGKVAAGGSDMRWVVRPGPAGDGKFGRVQAIDLRTGKTIWTRRQRATFASSTLATAGGLLFVGARDRTFRAYDSASGKALWSAPLPAAPNATPIAYAADGAQYVAVVAGGVGNRAWLALTPEIDDPPAGVTLMVFKLPAAAGRNAGQKRQGP